jgi:hypothetical protein
MGGTARRRDADHPRAARGSANPADATHSPGSRGTGDQGAFEHCPLTAEQIGRLSAAIAGDVPGLPAYPAYGLMVELMAYSGLRASEVAGLEVRDLAFAPGPKCTVKVVRTKERKRGRWVTGTPKSKKSRRTVPEPYCDRTGNIKKRCLAGEISCFANGFRWSHAPAPSFLKSVQCRFESDWGHQCPAGGRGDR